MDESKGQAGGVLTPVAEWQYRVWWNGDGGEPMGWGDWQKVRPRNRLSTVDDMLAELRAAIASGSRYEIRPLFTRPTPAAAAGVPTPEVFEAWLRREGFGVLDTEKSLMFSAFKGGWLASPVAPAGAPTEEKECLREVMEADKAYNIAQGTDDGATRYAAIKRLSAAHARARALLEAEHDSSHEAAPQSSVASPAPRSSLRASDRSELPREPSGEPSGEQPINETEAAAVPLHNLKRQNMTTITHQLTDGSIGSDISSEHYFNGGDGIYGAARKAGDDSIQAFPAALDQITFCVLVLHDGSTVTGESVCTNPENFDADREKKIARDCAAAKMVAP